MLFDTVVEKSSKSEDVNDTVLRMSQSSLFDHVLHVLLALVAQTLVDGKNCGLRGSVVVDSRRLQAAITANTVCWHPCPVS